MAPAQLGEPRQVLLEDADPAGIRIPSARVAQLGVDRCASFGRETVSRVHDLPEGVMHAVTRASLFLALARAGDGDCRAGDDANRFSSRPTQSVRRSPPLAL